jgi:16S rRNA C1402 N4-methylase RsmH
MFLQTFTDLISIFIYHFMTVRLAVICLHPFLGNIVKTFFRQNHYSCKCIYLANEKIKSKSVKSLSPLNLMGVVAHHLQFATEYRGVSKNLRNFYKITFLQTFADLISIFIYHFMTMRLAVICLHSFLGKIVPTFFHQNHYSNAYISQTKR